MGLNSYKLFSNVGNGSTTVNWNNGGMQELVLTANANVTFTAPTAKAGVTGNGYILHLLIKQTGTGGFSTFLQNVFSTTGNGYHMISATSYPMQISYVTLYWTGNAYLLLSATQHVNATV
mgnify:FL=1